MQKHKVCECLVTLEHIVRLYFALGPKLVPEPPFITLSYLYDIVIQHFYHMDNLRSYPLSLLATHMVCLIYLVFDFDSKIFFVCISYSRICEICCSTASNVVGVSENEPSEHWNEANTSAAPPPAPPSEARSFWQGHRFLKFLLACLVLAFVVSWLFHFNVPG